MIHCGLALPSPTPSSQTANKQLCYVCSPQSLNYVIQHLPQNLFTTDVQLWHLFLTNPIPLTNTWNPSLSLCSSP